MRLNAQAGRTLARSIGEARTLAAKACASARGRGAQAKLQAARRLEELADRCQRITAQIHQRQRGEKISDRLVSLADPDARPIRKGKLGTPNQFGYVVQLAEATANTGRGARGDVLPAASAPGNPGENRLLAQTAAELDRLGLRPREVALDGGFVPGPTTQALAAFAPTRMFISGRPSRAPGVPVGAWPATAPAVRAASATSSAATTCAAAG
jgi:IS5 family transposase